MTFDPPLHSDDERPFIMTRKSNTFDFKENPFYKFKAPELDFQLISKQRLEDLEEKAARLDIAREGLVMAEQHCEGYRVALKRITRDLMPIQSLVHAPAPPVAAWITAREALGASTDMPNSIEEGTAARDIIDYLYGEDS